ncbi:MAG: hypothetical protein ACLTOV_03465 [Phocaeicola sp.]
MKKYILMSMTAASLMMAFTEQAAAQAQQNRSAYFLEGSDLSA